MKIATMPFIEYEIQIDHVSMCYLERREIPYLTSANRTSLFITVENEEQYSESMDYIHNYFSVICVSPRNMLIAA